MSKGFGCCGGEGSGEQACECLPQELGHRVIPCGTRKLAGQERQYKNTTNQWLTRKEFVDWSTEQGKTVDPVIWFTDMGHGPIPGDVLVHL
ncbi:MAG: hypothetical protein HPY61_13785 [Methanotrichaceae archaeon]|nr:hypothetical protein [Methanotrichaceae archaeon]